MKRLLFSLITALQLLLLPLSAHAQARYWQVEIFDPANATTGTSIRFEYKVMSTVRTDDFTVKLYENGAVKGTQSVTEESGDSGAFTVGLPNEGTFNYFIRATNHGADDESKDTETVSVKVTDRPTRTVTVVRNEGGRGGDGSLVAGAAGTSGTTGAGGVVGEGGASTTGGNTQGENTEKQGEGGENKDSQGEVAGAESQANENKKGNVWVYIGVPLLILLLAGLLYWWRSRGTGEV